jgi:hypothetical protein
VLPDTPFDFEPQMTLILRVIPQVFYDIVICLTLSAFAYGIYQPTPERRFTSVEDIREPDSRIRFHRHQRLPLGNKTNTAKIEATQGLFIATSFKRMHAVRSGASSPCTGTRTGLIVRRSIVCFDGVVATSGHETGEDNDESEDPVDNCNAIGPFSKIPAIFGSRVFQK